MEVVVCKSTDAAVKLTAALLADAVKAKPDLVLGLATGRTMEAVYAELAEMCKNGLDFSLAKSFNLDEYIGLSGDNKNSYRYYMNHHLFNKINIDKRNTHLPNGMAKDHEAESERYEQEIADCGGVDIQLLGIGRDGHIGFNEPLSSLASRTRAKSLTKETYEQNSPLFGKDEVMPMSAFTMGVGTILDSDRVILLATGAEKAEIIAKAVEGPVTSMISASALQMHRKAVVIVDEEAAAKLTLRDYYDWVFEKEAKWAPYHNIAK